MQERIADSAPAVKPAAYRVNRWLDLVPIGRSKFYQEKNAGRIKTKKLGGATLVVTQPEDYVAALPPSAA